MRSLILLLALATIGAASEPPVTESFTQSYPMSYDGRVRLENLNGVVEIIGWDRNEVHVEAVKSAPTEEDLKRISLKIDAAYDRLSIKTEYEKKPWTLGTWRGEVRYTLHVPVNVRLEEISVINAAIRVREVTGPVHLKTVNGQIEATGLGGVGRFETVNGSISVSYARVTGIDAVALRTVNGQCDLTLPKDAAYHLSSKSVNGGVKTDAPVKVEKSSFGRFTGVSGEGGPEIDFSSVNGELAISTK